MSSEVLLLDSQLVEKLYGGTKIQEYFGFQKDLDRKIGEFWAVSAHPHAPSIVKEGVFKGKELKQVWDEHKELFNNSKLDRFPLLVKINVINSPVSIQVHPNDEYALKNENDLGKAEFCIFLEVEDGTKIVRGHSAQNEAEFRKMLEERKVDDLFIRRKVQSGDYVYTPPGIVHGVEGKMLLAEVQQSSNVTYRLYDYENVDEDGNLRELHIDKAIGVTKIPHEEPETNVSSIKLGKSTLTNYCDNEFFEIEIFDCVDEIPFKNDSYSLLTVLKGEGVLKVNNDKYQLVPGVNAIVTSLSKKYSISGNLKVLITRPPKE